MNPSTNPVTVKVYKIDPDAEKHEYRNRPVDKENSYTFVKNMKCQPVWYSQAEIRQLEAIDRVQYSGYFLFKNSHLKRLDINPADNNSWGRYRFLAKINGHFQEDYLEIVEIRPESPHCGTYKLWYGFFREVRPEGEAKLSENPTEDAGDFNKELGEMVDTVVRHY